MSTYLLCDLMSRGVRLESHEAIALAQQLIVCGAAAPSPDNIRLGADGSVECVGCDATPSVYEIGIFLQSVLPPDRVGVPGGVRYAIARSLHEVEARPFDSIVELSRALERYEKGDRRVVVSDLARRARPAAPYIAAVRMRAPAPPAEVAANAPEPQAVANERVAPFSIAAPRSSGWRGVAVAAALGGCFVVSILTAGLLRSARHAARPERVEAPIESATHGTSPTASTPAVAAATSPSAAREEAVHPSEATTPAPTGDAELSARSIGPRSRPRAAATAHAAGAPLATTRAAAATPLRQEAHPDASEQVVAALDSERRPVFSPAFASNGSAMFFHTGGSRDARSALAMSSGTPGYDLQVMTIVDDGARNYHVQPSPDGQLIAFDSDRDGERGVYVARRNGVDVRRISGPGYAAVPTWSPDGRRLAYIRAEDSNPKVWNLWLQPIDDSHATRLTHYRYGQTWSASWFPDNRRICYSHEDKLVILDLDTGHQRVIDSPVKGRLVRTPAVSPDGTKVIFQVYRQGAWMLDVGDGSSRYVLTDPTAEEFAWAPDGRHVAFHSRRDGQWGIYVITS